MNSRSTALFVALMLGLLAACSGSTSSGITAATPSVKPAARNSLLLEVRAAGLIGNELDVQPLRDPQVEDLRSAAMQAEERADFVAAEQALAQALRLTPDDPDLLQWQAELALVRRNWPQAEQLAMRSYAKGPKLGGLCRRNWTTIRIATQARSDATAAAQAQQRVTACTLAPPTRM